MSYLNTFIPTHEYLSKTNSDGCILNIQRPTEYVPWTPHKLLKNNDNKLFIYDGEHIKIHFENILNEYTSIEQIDGCYIDHDVKYQCNLCYGNIDDDYYYCQECGFDICAMCYNNKRGIGIESSTVINCVKEHQYIMMKRTISQPEICGLCHLLSLYHTKIIDTPYLYGNNYYSMCIPCSATVIGQEIIKKYGLELLTNKLPCYQMFGSLFDWVPIIGENKEKNNNVLLVNYNSSSSYCGRSAVYLEDNNKGSYHVLPSNLTLEDIILMITKNKNLSCLIKLKEIRNQ